MVFFPKHLHPNWEHGSIRNITVAPLSEVMTVTQPMSTLQGPVLVNKEGSIRAQEIDSDHSKHAYKYV